MAADNYDKIIVNNDNSIEQVRKCYEEDIDISWSPSFHSFEDCKNCNSKGNEINGTPLKINLMKDMSSSKEVKLNNSTQITKFENLLVDCDIEDIDLSCTVIPKLLKDNACYGSKRDRSSSFDADPGQLQPWKKTKLTLSCNSSMTNLLNKIKTKDSQFMGSSSNVSSASDVSFKSINSNTSSKFRNRRLKSDSSLIKNVLYRTKNSTNFNKAYHSTNGSPSGKKLNYLIVNIYNICASHTVMPTNSHKIIVCPSF